MSLVRLAQEWLTFYLDLTAVFRSPDVCAVIENSVALNVKTFQSSFMRERMIPAETWDNLFRSNAKFSVKLQFFTPLIPLKSR